LFSADYHNGDNRDWQAAYILNLLAYIMNIFGQPGKGENNGRYEQCEDNAAYRGSGSGIQGNDDYGKS
jgi:hypothetical protein